MITDLILNKTVIEIANIKAQAVVSSTVIGKYNRGNVDLDILSISKIEGGVEVFARVFKDGKQLGFGADGSVDIERFRLFNPPVMVPSGIKRIVPLGKDFDNKIAELDNFIEDPHRALLIALTHTGLQVGKEGTTIEIGKVGKTTDTFYPSAGASSPVDGAVNTNNAVWATARSAATGTAEVSDAAQIIQGEFTGGSYTIRRNAFCFDTSTIGSGKTISSATFSLYSTAVNDQTETTYPANFTIVQATLTGTANIVSGDFDLSHWGSTEFASRITLATFAASTGYKDFALNASGITNVNMTGISQFGVRPSNDLDNNAPSARSYGQFYMADQAGTTNDPKLVVTYTASETFIPRIIMS